MKNIYFFQVGFEFDKSIYLPYAAGTMIAYCKKFLPEKNEFVFNDIFFQRKPINDISDKISNPYMILFSCSVWNMEYNCYVAKYFKEKYKDTIIVFGGHSVDESGKLLKELNFVDILMFGEGEITLLNLLQNLSEDKINETDNIAFRKGDSIICTDRRQYNNLTSFPSPYTSGVFDSILKENPDMDFLAVLETNRGCPYNCAYCDWCSGRKVRHFPKEKVLSEIEWFGRNKIEYIFCADSNFGMFEKDFDFAGAIVEAKKKFGFPKVFRPCYEKNSDKRVFNICNLLNTENMDKGATFAYQTLSEEALSNIGRKNLTLSHFSALMQRYISAGIPTYSELILGLPGETRESFCRGICKLLESGQHNSISVYHCEMLPNSEMSKKEYREKHEIEIIKIEFNHIHSAPNKKDEIQEYSYIVRSTKSMNRDDWVYSNLFSVCVQLFHSLGLLRYVAIYLHTEKCESYYNFYTSLLDYILNSNTAFGVLFNKFRVKYENSLSGDWNYYNEKFGNVTWFFEEGAFLEAITNVDEYLEELTPFLEKYFVEKSVFCELMIYNKLLLRKPYSETKSVDFSFDFLSYFNSALRNEPTALKKDGITVFVRPEYNFSDISSYAKNVVWFGRRRGMTQLDINKEIYAKEGTSFED